MKNRSKLLVIPCLCVLLVLVSAGCDRISSTSIGKIIEKPREYAGKPVTVSGEVTDVFSLFLVKYFTIRDRTGELAVVSDKALPKKGTQVKVHGTIQEAFSIGDKQLLVLIESGEKK